MAPKRNDAAPDAVAAEACCEPERIQKFLARAGVGSRRSAEQMISDGRVSVNGAVVVTPGMKVRPGVDDVCLDGCPVEAPRELRYLMLNKPAGVVTTLDDPQGRPTVAGFMPADGPRLFPVGRLDLATTGLLLLTNDGELAHALMHPRHHVEKVYRAEVDGVPDAEDIRRLEEGIELDDGLTAPARAVLVEVLDGRAIVHLTLREGRKRQVRRMLSSVGHPVLELCRIAYGPLPLGELAEGAVRELVDDEVAQLRAAAGGAG
ncbi:MAG: rRNA pseudouridine synthase [Coriobacteriia bacterium]|nr:rRNA pseudouridine synthase [Coriobacteriia bacterium]